MGEPFIGEIKMTAFGYAPRGWADCHGQELLVNQNQSLFSLIWNQFGGDGRQTFNLPDFRGRAPMHPYSYYQQGDSGGTETVTLTEYTMPMHSHAVNAYPDDADEKVDTSATESVFAKITSSSTSSLPITAYTQSNENLIPMNGEAVVPAQGGNRGHNNMQPSTVIRFCIALDGVYPSRN